MTRREKSQENYMMYGMEVGAFIQDYSFKDGWKVTSKVGDTRITCYGETIGEALEKVARKQADRYLEIRATEIAPFDLSGNEEDTEWWQWVVDDYKKIIEEDKLDELQLYLPI